MAERIHVLILGPEHTTRTNKVERFRKMKVGLIHGMSGFFKCQLCYDMVTGSFKLYTFYSYSLVCHYITTLCLCRYRPNQCGRPCAAANEGCRSVFITVLLCCPSPFTFYLNFKTYYGSLSFPQFCMYTLGKAASAAPVVLWNTQLKHCPLRGLLLKL